MTVSCEVALSRRSAHLEFLPLPPSVFPPLQFWTVQESPGPSFRRYMRPSSCLLAFVLATVFLAAGPAQPRPAAAPQPSPCQAFASSPIVFVGEVLSVEETGGDFHMRLRVVRALKGIAATTADLWSDASYELRRQAGRGQALRHLHVPGGRPDVDRRLRLRSPARARRTRSRAAADARTRLRPRLASTTSIGSASSSRSSAIPSVRIALDLPAGRVTTATATSGAGSSSRTCRPARTSSSVDAGQGPDALDVDAGRPAGPRGLRRDADRPSSRRARCRAGC